MVLVKMLFFIGNCFLSPRKEGGQCFEGNTGIHHRSGAWVLGILPS